MRKKSLENLNKDNIKILVCCHKPCALPPNSDGIFLPIHVGAAISDVDMGMQRDDQVNGQPCDNISAKNKNYCELTAVYWAWKNIKKLYPNLEYIGLNHYRRYFDFNTKKNVKIMYQKSDFIGKINAKNLSSLLNKYDRIILKCNILRETLKTQYCERHYSEDFRLTEQAIEELHPEYKKAFRKYFENGVKFYQFNMFIMNISEFFSYCQWLFDILEYVRQKSIYTCYNNYQKRIFGFLAERLFTVYVCNASKKTKEIPVIFLDDTSKKKYEKNSCINKLLYLKKELRQNIKKTLNKYRNIKHSIVNNDGKNGREGEGNNKVISSHCLLPCQIAA